MSKVLGLDLGSNSLGWAIVDRENEKIIAAGVRLFTTGEGGDETPNQTRRQKRLARRQRRYRLARYKSLTNLLIANKFLPEFEESEDRHQYLNRLDKEIYDDLKKRIHKGEIKFPDHTQEQVEERFIHAQCYFLRYFSLKYKVPNYWIGRSILHMSRFRGFSYQIKTQNQVDKEFKESDDIDYKGENLREKLKKESITLAQEFASRSLEKRKISKDRWTSRFSLKEEFKSLEKKVLSKDPELRKVFEEIYRILFKQRHIRIKRTTIGRCEIFPNSERASKALPVFQEFKIWQALSNFRVYGTQNGSRELTLDEKKSLVDFIWKNGKCTEKELLEEIGLKKIKGQSSVSTNFEEMKDQFKHEIILLLIKSKEETDPIYWEKWDETKLNDFCCSLLRFNDPQALERHLIKKYDIPEAHVQNIINGKIPQGRGSYSSKAIKEILEKLKTGMLLKQVRELLGSNAKVATLDKLPPVSEAYPRLRDPAVVSSLSQMRKVVNAIIEKYGKPNSIRIELARSKKLSAAQNGKINRLNKNLKNEKEVAEEWLQKSKLETSDTNVVKMRLWRECGHTCTYCGINLSFEMTFQSNKSQIDHIWPYSRTLDDRYVNKILCCSKCNSEKSNKTPYETWGKDTLRWPQIISRFDRWVTKSCPNDEEFSELPENLRNLVGDSKLAAKRNRVLKEGSDIVDGFLARQLHTTGYASKLARDYLKYIYDDVEKINVSSGFITGRYRFGLRPHYVKQLKKHTPLILDDEGKKAREDHRHHAMDAVFIAISDDKARVALTSKWSKGTQDKLPAPWLTFGNDLATTLEPITPSVHFPQRGMQKTRGVNGYYHIKNENEDKSKNNKNTITKKTKSQYTPRGELHDEKYLSDKKIKKNTRIKNHPASPKSRCNTTENAFVMVGKDFKGGYQWQAVSLWDWADHVRKYGEKVPESFKITIRKKEEKIKVLHIYKKHEIFKLKDKDGLWRLRSANNAEFLFIPINDAREPRWLRDNKVGVYITGSARLAEVEPQKIILNALGQEVKKHEKNH